MDPDASPDELKRAYRKAARAWHPDRNDAPEAEARFKEVASAWEIVGDPAARRRHQLVHERADRGQLSEDFLLDVADAIERAETWIREVVLPHYARYWRGHGAEMATRLFRDLDDLRVPARLEPAGWRRRRVVEAKARKVVVTLRFGRSPNLSTVLYGRTLTEVAILPQALWDAGFRDNESLDDAVMQLLLGRFAHLMGPARIPRTEADWDEAVAEARAVDDGPVSQQRLSWALWAVAAGLVAAMVAGAVMRG